MKPPTLLKDLLRGAFVGFATLLTIGAVMVSSPKGLDGSDRTPAELAAEANERIGIVAGFSIAGAVIGALTMLLLRLFDVGPKTKVAFGTILGPLAPVVLFGAGMLREGKPDHLGALVVVAAIAGLFTGLLEASRVAKAAPVGDRI